MALLSSRRLKTQVDRLRNWREWEADAETIVELCGDGDGGGDEEAKDMLGEAMEVRTAVYILQRSARYMAGETAVS